MLSSSEQAQSYWKANVRLLTVCLVIWFIVSYGCGILFVEQLNEFKILGGYKLGFWFAQQGSIYVFIILTFFYAFFMNGLDKKYDFDEK